MASANSSTISYLLQMSGASLLNAQYTSHVFAPHYHEELSVGVIQQGKLHVQIGKHHRMTLSAGDIVIINPGEIHEGYTGAADGCFYRMFYLPATLLGKVTGLDQEYYPHFASCAVDDPSSAKQLSWLHRNLMTPSVSPLEFESHLFEVVNHLIGHYADELSPSLPQAIATAGNIRDAICDAQAYLAAHCDETVSLNLLATHVGLSPFHLIRSFKAAIGMTPHAFQTQMRIDQAKAQLMRGESIANVAVNLGFHDQSHLTKHFKALVGVTPQRFRQNNGL